jgi:hypothetical protein
VQFQHLQAFTPRELCHPPTWRVLQTLIHQDLECPELLIALLVLLDLYQMQVRVTVKMTLGMDITVHSPGLAQHIKQEFVPMFLLVFTPLSCQIHKLLVLLTVRL